jgi:hypothetical protein
MITSAAPPPDAAADGKRKQKQKQKRGHSAAERPSPSRHSVPPPSSSTTMEQPRFPRSKRNYPSEKKLSGGGRMRATARALVRGLSVVNVKRDSRGRSGFEAV